MSAGGRITLSIAAALALPAYFGVLYLTPLWLLGDILIVLSTCFCALVGISVYRRLGN